MKTLLRFALLALLLASGASCRKKNQNPLAEDPLSGLPADGSLLGGDLAGDGIGLSGRDLFEGKSPIDSSMFAPVYFAFDSSAITSGEMFKVQAVASHLQSNRNDVVVIQGHTDERGSREYNLALGERRALAVREALVALGISADRIQTLSFGEEQPAVAGTGEAVWSLNRRAEFQLMR